MKRSALAVLLLAAIFAVVLPLAAHHGNAAYDMNEFTIKGATVTDFFWANPHTIITFDVKDDSGKIAHWSGELGSPSALTNLGWTKVSLSKGDVVTIYIHRSKTNNPVGRITRVELPDGTSLRDSGGTSGGNGQY